MPKTPEEKGKDLVNRAIKKGIAKYDNMIILKADADERTPLSEKTTAAISLVQETLRSSLTRELIVRAMHFVDSGMEPTAALEAIGFSKIKSQHLVDLGMRTLALLDTEQLELVTEQGALAAEYLVKCQIAHRGLENSLLSAIMAHTPREWRAAAKLLEQLYPEKYGQQKPEVAVQINNVTSESIQELIQAARNASARGMQQ